MPKTQSTFTLRWRGMLPGAIFSAALLVLIAAVWHNTPSSVSAEDYTIRITDTGLEPGGLSILPGDTVTWVNETEEPQELAVLKQLYVPLVVRSVAGEVLNMVSQSLFPGAQKQPNVKPGSSASAQTSILPGEEYRRLFEQSGMYRCMIGEYECEIFVVTPSYPGTDPYPYPYPDPVLQRSPVSGVAGPKTP